MVHEKRLSKEKPHEKEACEEEPVKKQQKKKHPKKSKKIVRDTPRQTLYDHQDVIYIAKVLYNECRGIGSDTEKACVAWVILNRVDAWDANIAEIVQAPYQFAYYEDTPIDDELLNLSHDVLERWEREKYGDENVGRVIPPDYIFFTGDGESNYFRKELNSVEVWQYTITSPYND